MNKNEWINKCQYWKEKWNFNNEYKNLKNSSEKVISNRNISFHIIHEDLNLYSVIEELNNSSDSNDIFVCDAGSMSYVCPVVLKIRGNQKLISSPAQADMGWALPASIGVALNTKRRVIVLIGDGSFMSNLQELAVIQHHNLNIKIIVLNNNGYLSIRNTQNKFFEGRVFGTGQNNGLWFPEFFDIATTFSLDHETISSLDDLKKIYLLLNETENYPCIIECLCDIEQEIIPAQALKNGKQCGLHDMYPFLSDEELNEEMIITL